MLEVKGDFWEEVEKQKPTHIVCTCNGVLNLKNELIMGKGIAKQFRDRYKGLAKEAADRLLEVHGESYHHSRDDYGIVAGLEPRDGVSILLLQTKRHWRDESPKELVIDSCMWMNAGINMISIAQGLECKIVMTRPGCGNGGLDWDDFKEDLDFLDDRYIVVNKE